MEKERLRCSSGASVADAINLMVQTVLVAEKSIVWPLFLLGSVPNNGDAFSNLLESDKRFPLSDLKNVATRDAECKDASETEDDSDDEDADVGDDSSGEDNDDDEVGADSDSDANDDDDDEDDDGDDDEEDEEGENQPPFKKKK